MMRTELSGCNLLRESCYARGNFLRIKTIWKMNETFVANARWKIHSPAPLTRSPPALDFYAAPRSCCDIVRRCSRRPGSANRKNHKEITLLWDGIAARTNPISRNTITPRQISSSHDTEFVELKSLNFNNISCPTMDTHVVASFVCPFVLFISS